MFRHLCHGQRGRRRDADNGKGRRSQRADLVERVTALHASSKSYWQKKLDQVRWVALSFGDELVVLVTGLCL
jgi:hypothetical protein